jgi:CRP/FNR family transcriptional regulator
MTAKFNIATVETSCKNCSLSELCLPRGLSDDEMQTLDTLVEKRKPYNAGEYLFQSGQAFKKLFAIKSGSVKVVLPSEDGEQQIIGFFMPGELLGLDAMGKDKHVCSAIALETTSVCSLPYNEMQEICHDIKSLSKQFLSLISSEIGNEHQMLLTLGKKKAEARLATFLINLSSRYSRRGLASNEFNLTMSRHDISNYLGLAVETVSRLFTRLQEDSILSVDRRLVKIVDHDKLNALAKL